MYLMGTNWKSDTLKIKVLICLLVLNTAAFAQRWVPVDTLFFDHEISAVSLDRKDQIYLGFSTGHVTMINVETQEVLEFQNPNLTSVSHIEAWNTLRPFIFYRDIQSYLILDRFLTQPRQYQIQDLDLPFIELMSPGPSSIYALSSTDLVLSKMGILNGQLEVSYPVSRSTGISRPVFMRVYQNTILLSDLDKGLIIMDLFGNILQTFPDLKLSSFQIRNDYLISLHEDSLITLHVFKDNRITKTKLPEAFDFLIKTEQHYCLIRNKNLYIYRLEN